MSRETDSSSSGPQGRGGAAYPSGTPPYGSGRFGGGAAADGEPKKPDAAKSEPKTETTITTRIRINIPGSRPIPPVVVRKPANEPGAGAADAPAAPGGSGGEAEAERTAAMPVPSFGGPGGPAGPGSPGAPAPADGGAAAGDKAANDWFAPRKSGTNGAGIKMPADPGAGVPGGAPAGAGPVPGGPGGPHGPGGSGTGRPHSALSDLSGAAGAGTAAPAGFAPGSDAPPHGVRPSAGAGPDGPTTGPARGAMQTGAPVHAGAVAAPPRMSDDTAVLTPQRPAPGRPAGPGGPGAPAGQGGPGDHVSGDTLTSGVAPVRPDAESPFPAGPGAAGKSSGPSGPGGSPASASPAPAPASRPAPPPPTKKGRSKTALIGVAVVVLGAVAYGAGLLLNHSDVPKSTTVLGVDIGGGTRDQAVDKLQGALGKRAATPLQLSVGGKKIALAPDKAGLSFDAQTTVRNAAGSDYNPMSVIGSLFGGERVAEPEIVIDEEKLRVALADLAGNSGSAVEGTIRFEPGKIVVVPGKAGQGIDVNRSLTMVKDAYRAQVESGRPNAVQLPVAGLQPSISQAELDRAEKEFAEPAMSDLITIRAGGRKIDFGPQRSLPRILSMKAVNGKLVEVYNKEAIEELVGGTFQGVMVTKADGKKQQLNADDIAKAMGPALRGETRQDRTVDIK
ncbi:peptidoglycan binding domain-containing protein [Streptomyces tsukubensis]|uniref:peptidoglycan binding domain-containing protein n=1 Tax=Streptomyces tsukubensis TaxID=83656 RepID=UPI003673B0D0